MSPAHGKRPWANAAEAATACRTCCAIPPGVSDCGACPAPTRATNRAPGTEGKKRTVCSLAIRSPVPGPGSPARRFRAARWARRAGSTSTAAARNLPRRIPPGPRASASLVRHGALRSPANCATRLPGCQRLPRPAAAAIQRDGFVMFAVRRQTSTDARSGARSPARPAELSCKIPGQRT
jgi:hypothetical protein